MGTALLLTAAVIFRVLGAAARSGNQPLLYVAGWIICVIAGWLVASAAGALSPLWLVFALGTAGALIDFRRGRQEVWSSADALIVLSSGLLSVLRIDYTVLVGLILVAIGIGFAIDVIIRRSSDRFRVRVLGTLTVVVVTSGLLGAVTYRHPSQPRLLLAMLRRGDLLHSGILPEHRGKRLVLETGAVAWLDQPAGDGPFPAVLSFHGADAEGSRQSSALVLRRALLDAGFVVLSVDHPGFGESPVPAVGSEIAAWNPLPTARAAFETIRSIPSVDKIYGFGHSLGATDVLRLLSVERGLAGAVIFGSALNDSDPTDYWYWRFHTDRRMPNSISRDQYRQIAKYYNVRSIVEILPLDHAPLLFVRFDLDWEDIAAGRESLYNSIPGHKLHWTLGQSHHYFNSHKWAFMVVVDTRVIRSLVARVRLLGSFLEQPAGSVESSPR